MKKNFLYLSFLLVLMSGYLFCADGTNDLSRKDIIKDPQILAEKITEQITKKMGNVESFRKNVISPMQGGQPLSSFNDEKQFNIDNINKEKQKHKRILDCYSSSEALKIAAKFSSSGDLQVSGIELDKCLMMSPAERKIRQGTGWQVSGICNNGFIQCDAGTWNRCHGYKWSYRNQRLYPEHVKGISLLSSCHCINNSCLGGRDRPRLEKTVSDLERGILSVLGWVYKGMDATFLPTGDLQVSGIELDRCLMMSPAKRKIRQGTSWQVSGVCNNGFIQCDAGTWNRCLGYRWSYGKRGFHADRVDWSELSSCYCINNSCLKGKKRPKLEPVLSVLGQGVISVFGQAYKGVSISKAKTGKDFISYTGKRCSPVSSKDEKLYSENMTDGELRSKGAKGASGNELAAKVKGIGVNQPVTERSCVVERSLVMDEKTIDDIIVFNYNHAPNQKGVRLLDGVGTVERCLDEENCLELFLGNPKDNEISDGLYQQDMVFTVKVPDRIISATLHKAVYDDHFQIQLNGEYVWSGPKPGCYNDGCLKSLWTDLNGWQNGSRELGRSFSENLSVDFTSSIKRKGDVTFRVRLAVGDKGEGYAMARIKVDGSCRLLDDEIRDGCGLLENNNKCVLVSEKVDSVPVFHRRGTLSPYGGDPAPPERSRRIDSKYRAEKCSITESRPWWRREKTYECKEEVAKYDFSKGLKRRAYVLGHSTEKKVKDRPWSDKKNKFDDENVYKISPPEDKGEKCINYCKVTRQRVRTDVNSSREVSSEAKKANNKNKSGFTIDTSYRPCQGKKADTCPIEDNSEKVKIPCKCIEEFGYSVAAMKIMEEAGKDTGCN